MIPSDNSAGLAGKREISNLPAISKLSDWAPCLQNLAENRHPENDVSALVEELQVYYEELKVAEERLILQHEEVIQSREILRAERQRYQELFDFAPDGYVVTNISGTIQEANLAAIQLVGVRRKQLLGKRLISFIQKEDRQNFHKYMRDAACGRSREWQTAVISRNGNVRPVEVTISQGGESNRDLILRWSLRDISKRARAERELHDKNQMLAALVQSSHLGVFVLAPDETVTLWNPAAERLFGWKAEEVLMGPLPIIPPEREEEFRILCTESKQGRRHEALETQRSCKDGRLLDVAIWTSPLRSANGEIKSVMVTIADITERKRSDELRRQLHQRILEVQEEERRRISRELHDHLGQQLTVILLGLKALRNEGLPHGDRRSAGEKIDRLYELVDTAMRESHHLAWELRPTALDDLGLEVALQRYVYQWSENSGIKADFQSLGFGNARLAADLETTLYRVAQEALTNVARHSHANFASVILELNLTHASLVVEDDGTGFDVQSTASSHRLGLSGMRERLALVRGSLEIESELGRGTSLFARAPRKT